MRTKHITPLGCGVKISNSACGVRFDHFPAFLSKKIALLCEAVDIVHSNDPVTCLICYMICQFAYHNNISRDTVLHPMPSCRPHTSIR